MSVLSKPAFQVAFRVMLGGLLLWGGVLGVEWLIPRIIDLTAIKTEIEQTASQEFFEKQMTDKGWQLKIGDLQVKLGWEGALAQFSEIYVLDSKVKQVVSVPTLTATLRYWPMIVGGTPELGKVELSQLSVNLSKNPHLKDFQPNRTLVSSEKETKNPLTASPSRASEKKSETSAKKTKPPIRLSDTTFIIREHHLTLGSWLDQKSAWRVIGKGLELQHLESKTPLWLRLNSGFSFQESQNTNTQPQKLGELTLEVEIPQTTLLLTEKALMDLTALHRLKLHLKNLSLPAWQALLVQYNLPFRGEGMIDSFKFDYRQNKPQASYGVLIEHFRLGIQALEPSHLMVGDYTFDFEPGMLRANTRLVERQQLDNTLIHIESEPYRFDLAGNIKLPASLSMEILEKEDEAKPFWGNSQLDLTLNTTMLPISLLRVLPDDSPLGQLFAQSNGLIKFDTHLTGPLSVPAIQGAIQLEDLAFTHQKLDRVTWELIDGGIEHLYGLIQFEEQRVRLNHLRGELNGTPFQINGQYHRKDKTLSKVRLKSSQLDLNDLRLTLLHFGSIFQLPLPLEKIKQMELEGHLNMDIKADGLLAEPEIKGQARFQSVGVHPIRYPAQEIVHQLNSLLHFEGKTLSFTESSGFFQGQRFQWFGTYQLKKQAFDLVLQGRSLQLAELVKGIKILSNTLKTDWPMTLTERINLSGTMDSRLHLAGTVDVPNLTGRIQLNQINAVDSASPAKISDLRGILSIQPTGVQLKEIQGQLGPIDFQVDGHLKGKTLQSLETYKFHLLSPNIDLKKVGLLLQKFPDLKQAQAFDSLMGQVNVDLTAQGNLKSIESTNQMSGTVDVKGLSIRPENLGVHVTLDPVRLYFDETGQLTFPKTTGMLGQLAFDVMGKASQKFKTYTFSVDTGNVALSLLNSQRAYFEKMLGLNYRPLDKTDGTFRLLADITPGRFLGDLSFKNAGLSWTDLPEISQLNGHMKLQLDEKGHPSLRSEALTFDVGRLRVENHLDAKLEQLPAKAARNRLPFKADANLDMKIWPKHDLAREPLAHIQANLHEQGHQLMLEDTAITLHQVGKILMEGLIEHPLTPEKRGFSMKVYTPESLTLQSLGEWFEEPFNANGQLNLDLGFSGHNQDDMLLVGAIELDRIHLPPLRISELSGDIQLTGMDGTINLHTIKLPGVSVSMKGFIEDTMMYPLPLSKVAITGDLFVVPAWEQYVKDIGEGLIRKHFVIPLFGPIKPEDPVVPIEFRDATLFLSEVIYDNIIFNQVQGTMNLNGSGFFELIDTQVDTAGGRVKLDLSMNPKNNNFTSATIDVVSVKANALARALLNAPNQIFGDLSGHIVFATEGVEDENLMNNANGTMQFAITDGRLPAIAKIETLLAGANVIRGGLLGLNLNNIFRALSPFNTNYFAELSGNLKIAEGVAHTDDMLSDGENLDLLIEGRIRLLDSDADLTVHGSMNQDMTGVLGKLGKLSLRSLVRFVPGIGFIPGSESGGLASFIPGVGYVPGLGGRAKKLNRFQVKIEGPLDDPKSVQSFDWVP